MQWGMCVCVCVCVCTRVHAHVHMLWGARGQHTVGSEGWSRGDLGLGWHHRGRGCRPGPSSSPLVLRGAALGTRGGCRKQEPASPSGKPGHSLAPTTLDPTGTPGSTPSGQASERVGSTQGWTSPHPTPLPGAPGHPVHRSPRAAPDSGPRGAAPATQAFHRLGAQSQQPAGAAPQAPEGVLGSPLAPGPTWSSPGGTRWT